MTKSIEVKAGGDVRASADEVRGDKIEGKARRFRLLSLKDLDTEKILLVGALGIMALVVLIIGAWGIFGGGVPDQMWNLAGDILLVIVSGGGGIALGRKAGS